MMVQIMPSLPCPTGAVVWLQPPGRASPRYCLEPSQVLQPAAERPTCSTTAVSIPFLCPSWSPTHQLRSRGVPLSFCSLSCRKPSSNPDFFAQACCCVLGCG